MKYMNNHYGKSKIFGRSRCEIPMNLQFFAESAGDGGDGAEGSGQASEGMQENTPSVEELMAQLAQERAENAKNKNALDKALREKGELTKNLRAKMTAEEQEQEAKKEAEEAKDARIQELESKFRTMDYSKRYMGIGMDEKTAESLSELTGELADADKFFSALGKFITASNKAAEENYRQELIKNNPEINAGSGSDTRSSLAEERAISIGKRAAGANEDILKYYRR